MEEDEDSLAVFSGSVDGARAFSFRAKITLSFISEAALFVKVAARISERPYSPVGLDKAQPPEGVVNPAERRCCKKSCVRV